MSTYVVSFATFSFILNHGERDGTIWRCNCIFVVGISLAVFIFIKVGLKTDELASLEQKFTNLNLLNSKQEHFFEVDTQGIRVLNILCGDDYNYRITSQSMAMEKTNIGGRTIQVQKLVWTLGKLEV